MDPNSPNIYRYIFLKNNLQDELPEATLSVSTEAWEMEDRAKGMRGRLLTREITVVPRTNLVHTLSL